MGSQTIKIIPDFLDCYHNRIINHLGGNENRSGVLSMKKPVIWITNGTARPFYARKEFILEQPVQKARLYASGLGQFILSVNGRKTGDHVLDPGWTNYHRIVQYVIFDVTSLLRPGLNAAGIEVGNGWYIRDFRRYVMKYPAFKPPIPNPYKPFGNFLVAFVRLEILFKNGKTLSIETGEDWKTCTHPVTLSNVYGSELLDGRLVQKGWNQPGFDDGSWPNALVLPQEEAPRARLLKQSQPPVIVKKTYPAEFLYSRGECLIYDLKQNMSGMLEFEVKGKRGYTIDVLPAEKLEPGGNIDQTAKGWGEINVMETYIIGADDEWEKFTMSFTYFAGRYLAFRGVNPPDVCIRNVCAHFITSAVKTTGTINCDDKRYEKIYDLVLKSVECNLLSVHTDCPSIERFAWQEPNHLMAPSIMYMKNVKSLWQKYLFDLRTDQCTADECYDDGKGGLFYPGEGLIPAVAPRYEDNVLPSYLGSFFDIIPWGSTCILGPYRHYMFYGDKKIIRDNYEVGKKYLAHLKNKMTFDGFINHGLGDWGNPDKECLARENIETAFLYADVKTLSLFASILILKDDEKYFRSFSEEIKDNYNRLLLAKDSSTGLYCYRTWDHKNNFHTTQACQALPLYWGMVPKDKCGDVINSLKTILEKDGKFISGEIGLPYIIQTMRMSGMNKLICDFILREKHPSYYAFVKNGETTLGEFWEDNPRSRCHDMMGHIAEWFYNGIAGIVPLEPGFTKILIKPYLPETMNYYQCSYSSVRGKITVRLERDNSHVRIRYKVPAIIEYLTDSSELEREGLSPEWIQDGELK
jgi:hypothetical protein